MFNKLLAGISILFISLLFTTASLAQVSQSKMLSADTEIWHVRWITSTHTFTALWAKRNARGEYYGLWSNGDKGNLVITKTADSFRGTSTTQGGVCNFSGTLQRDVFNGNYSCNTGDVGSLNGNITYGFAK